MKAGIYCNSCKKEAFSWFSAVDGYALKVTCKTPGCENKHVVTSRRVRNGKVIVNIEEQTAFC